VRPPSFSSSYGWRKISFRQSGSAAVILAVQPAALRSSVALRSGCCREVLCFGQMLTGKTASFPKPVSLKLNVIAVIQGAGSLHVDRRLGWRKVFSGLVNRPIVLVLGPRFDL
jgi:hypothetical protein